MFPEIFTPLILPGLYSKFSFQLQSIRNKYDPSGQSAKTARVICFHGG